MEPLTPDPLPNLGDWFRTLVRRIVRDPRIWMIPVILAIAWVPDVRVFIALPIIIGVIFIVLIVRQSRRGRDRQSTSEQL